MEFRHCARPVLGSNTACVVSSCMIRAGDGICSQSDTAAAIDENLNCVFKQVKISIVLFVTGILKIYLYITFTISTN